MRAPGDGDEGAEKAESEAHGDASSRASSSPDPRARAAWRTWLQAMATDADAALSAAFAYQDLAAEGRAAWLDALRDDVVGLDVAAVAVYAPLLAVEEDPERRATIERAIASDVPSEPMTFDPWALASREPDGCVVAVVASPLYLGFVELLVCRFHPDRGVASALHEPLVDRRALATGRSGFPWDASSLAPASLDEIVEGLAHAILADRRRGVPAAAPLVHFAHLFTATPAPSEATRPSESDREPEPRSAR